MQNYICYVLLLILKSNQNWIEQIEQKLIQDSTHDII